MYYVIIPDIMKMVLGNLIKNGNKIGALELILIAYQKWAEEFLCAV